MKGCELKYKWAITPSGQSSPIILTSTPEEIGVNVTTNPAFAQQNS
jgi:hypothetical protein